MKSCATKPASIATTKDPDIAKSHRQRDDGRLRAQADQAPADAEQQRLRLVMTKVIFFGLRSRLSQALQQGMSHPPEGAPAWQPLRPPVPFRLQHTTRHPPLPMITASKCIAKGRGLAPVLIRRAARVPLDWDTRSKSRFDAEDSSGRRLGVFLPRGQVLRGGDVLLAEDGSVIVVDAAPQPVLQVRHCAEHGSPFDLLRAAYHLGNRHVPLELQPDLLQLEPDPVLAAMLRGMHLIVCEAQAPFEPEGGAYAGAHAHAHPHPHEHAQGHGHSHGHGHGQAQDHHHAHGHGQAQDHGHAHHHPHGEAGHAHPNAADAHPDR
jgi:urease accessory protein